MYPFYNKGSNASLVGEFKMPEVRTRKLKVLLTTSFSCESGAFLVNYFSSNHFSLVELNLKSSRSSVFRLLAFW